MVDRAHFAYPVVPPVALACEICPFEAQDLPAAQTFAKGELPFPSVGTGVPAKKKDLIPLADEDEKETKWRRRR